MLPGDGREWLESFYSDAPNPNAPFLFVDGNIGVPEKVLYRCYAQVVKAFAELRSKAEARGGYDESVLRITAVILLANPAHQTALNARKRVFSTPVNSIHVNAGKHSYEAELAFIAALLSVKQCAKISALWHHRRALLCALHTSSDWTIQNRVCFNDDVFVSTVSIPPSALQAEISLTERACEVYPRSYYPWCHRSLCVQTYVHSLRHARSLNSEEASRAFETLLREEFNAAQRWLVRHVSDHSAADHLCRVSEYLDALGLTPEPSHTDVDVKTYASYAPLCAQHARELVARYPTHETLWLYLRRSTSAASGQGKRGPESGSGPERKFRTEKVGQADESAEAEALARMILLGAKGDCESGADTGTGQASLEAHTKSRHAARFLVWQMQAVRLLAKYRDEHLFTYY